MPNTPTTRRRMGLGGSSLAQSVVKVRNRWFLKIEPIDSDQDFSISTEPKTGLPCLFPQKAARPGFSFKEFSVEHLIETIWFPAKPEWKPINVVAYDTARYPQIHPAMAWIMRKYSPYQDEQGSNWYHECCYGQTCASNTTKQFKVGAVDLELRDGCGCLLEWWTFQNVWIQNVEFGELDYAGNEYVTCDMTLRYDRAIWNYTKTNQQSRNAVNYQSRTNPMNVADQQVKTQAATTDAERQQTQLNNDKAANDPFVPLAEQDQYNDLFKQALDDPATTMPDKCKAANDLTDSLLDSAYPQVAQCADDQALAAIDYFLDPERDQTDPDNIAEKNAAVRRAQQAKQKFAQSLDAYRKKLMADRASNPCAASNNPSNVYSTLQQMNPYGSTCPLQKPDDVDDSGCKLTKSYAQDDVDRNRPTSAEEYDQAKQDMLSALRSPSTSDFECKTAVNNYLKAWNKRDFYDRAARNLPQSNCPQFLQQYNSWADKYNSFNDQLNNAYNSGQSCSELQSLLPSGVRREVDEAKKLREQATQAQDIADKRKQQAKSSDDLFHQKIKDLNDGKIPPADTVEPARQSVLSQIDSTLAQQIADVRRRETQGLDHATAEDTISKLNSFAQGLKDRVGALEAGRWEGIIQAVSQMNGSNIGGIPLTIQDWTGVTPSQPYAPYYP